MPSIYFTPPRPRLFAHRGSSADFPENTLPAFAHAVAAGLDYLELDVWASRDGVVVVHHDASLERTCGINQSIYNVRMDELRHVDAGCNFTLDKGASFPFRGKGISVPTLMEILEEFRDTFINIEIKQSTPPIERLVVEAVQRCKADARVLIASEHDQVLERLRPLCPHIPTNLGRQETTEFFQRLAAGRLNGYQPRGNALQIPLQWQGRKLIEAPVLEAAHQLGLEVHVWTINSTEDMAELLSLGVDGLMSDHSRLLAETAAGRGHQRNQTRSPGNDSAKT